MRVLRSAGVRSVRRAMRRRAKESRRDCWMKQSQLERVLLGQRRA